MRGVNVRADVQESDLKHAARTNWQLTAKSISIKGSGCESGGWQSRAGKLQAGIETSQGQQGECWRGRDDGPAVARVSETAVASDPGTVRLARDSEIDCRVIAQPAEPPYSDPHVRWCGRGGEARLPPIPIGTAPLRSRLGNAVAARVTPSRLGNAVAAR
jgi:hypothetical protein